MEEDAVGVAGLLHHVHGYAVGGEQLDALLELILFTHGYPNVGVDRIRALNVVDILGELDLRAGGLCKLLHLLNEAFLGEEALGSDANEVHAELCGDDHEGVAHVVAGIANVNELDLVEGLCNVFHDGEAVRQNLSGMIQVGEAVPYGNAGVLGEQLNGLLLEAAELDAVVEAAENLRGILEGLLLAHLAVGEEGHVCALVEGGNFECAAGAGGGLLEKKNDVLAFEQVALDAGALLGLQIGGKVEEVADLIGGEVLEGEQAAAFKIDGHGKSPFK